MKCPRCKSFKTSVKHTSRETGSPRVVRKRQCEACGHKFQTLETPQPVEDIQETPVTEETVDKPKTAKSRSRKKTEPEEKSED